MAATTKPPTGSSKPTPRGPKPKTPLSVQVARASWQFVGITAVVAVITLTVGKREPSVRAIAEIVIALMAVCSIGFGIFGLVAWRRERENDDESELLKPLLNNSLVGFLAVAILLGATLPLFLNARATEKERLAIANATPVPTANVTPEVTPRTVTSSGPASASPGASPKAGGPEVIAVEEGRTFAKSYVTLIQRNLFDEAYKYLPTDVRERVNSKQHQDLWITAAGVDREEIVIADASESAGGKAVEVRVTIPGKADPQVLVVQKSGEKIWATPRQFVKP